MIQNYAQAWKFLKEQTAKVRDPLLRNVMMAEFRKRALNEWQFDPESGDLPTINDIKMDEWEKDFLEDLQITQKFNIDTREEKRKKTLDETRACMQHFVLHGGQLSDIPEDILTPKIRDLYYQELFRIGNGLARAADDLMENAND